MQQRTLRSPTDGEIASEERPRAGAAKKALVGVVPGAAQQTVQASKALMQVPVRAAEGEEARWQCPVSYHSVVASTAPQTFLPNLTDFMREPATEAAEPTYWTGEPLNACIFTVIRYKTVTNINQKSQLHASCGHTCCGCCLALKGCAARLVLEEVGGLPCVKYTMAFKCAGCCVVCQIACRS